MARIFPEDTSDNRRETPLTLSAVVKYGGVIAFIIGTVFTGGITWSRMDDRVRTLEHDFSDMKASKVTDRADLDGLKAQLQQINHKLDLMLCAASPGKCDQQLRLLQSKDE